MAQDIQGHLKYTLRLVERAVDDARRDAAGQRDFDLLKRIERLLWAEFLRQQTLQAYEEVRHPIVDLIHGWPPDDQLTVALRAVVNHAWRPVEFGEGGMFSFPNPNDS